MMRLLKKHRTLIIAFVVMVVLFTLMMSVFVDVGCRAWPHAALCQPGVIR